MSQDNENNRVRDVIQVDAELLEDISKLIEDEAGDSLRIIFADLHAADIAEIINRLPVDEARFAFNLLDTETAGEVVVELDENIREKILEEIDSDTIVDIVEELELDDATDIVSDLPDEVAEHVLENLDEEDSAEVKELLKYPEDSAGGIMSSDYIYVMDSSTINDAIEEVRKNSDEYEHIYQVYVLKSDDTLLGIVALKSLLLHPPDTPIKSVMDEDLIYVYTNDDQESVASIMEKYDLVSVAVVDKDKKMLGRITIDDIVDVIKEEATEDIQRIAGLSEEQEHSDSIFRISRIRLPWLLIALILEMLNALVLSSYDKYLKELIAAAFFIPVVMAMGGGSASQAAIVMVRGLSTGDIWLSDSVKNIIKEFWVAILNGIACGVVLMGMTFLIFPRDEVSLNFALLLSLTLIIIMIFATIVGAIVPVVLKKMKIDPAISTGPFVQTTNDILGLFIYFTIITKFFLN